MALFQIPTLIYNQMYAILMTSDFDYFVTRDRGFYPRQENLLHPTLYPWAFIEFVNVPPIGVKRAPQVWEYELTLGLVMMTHADKGDPTSLVVNDGTNDNKGILDMVADVGLHYWGGYKDNHFGIDGVNDWNIGRVGIPSVLNVQRLLMHPLLRGVQIDFVFEVVERG